MSQKEQDPTYLYKPQQRERIVQEALMAGLMSFRKILPLLRLPFHPIRQLQSSIKELFPSKYFLGTKHHGK